MKHRWVIQLRVGNWDHPDCAMVSNLVLGTITTIVGNRGSFFYLPPKIMVHGMNERKFPGREKNISPVFVVFVSFPTFTKPSKNRSRAPKHLLGSPMSIVSLDGFDVGICWEMILNIPGPKEHCHMLKKIDGKYTQKGMFHCYPDHTRNRFKKDDESNVATIH